MSRAVQREAQAGAPVIVVGRLRRAWVNDHVHVALWFVIAATLLAVYLGSHYLLRQQYLASPPVEQSIAAAVHLYYVAEDDRSGRLGLMLEGEPVTLRPGDPGPLGIGRLSPARGLLAEARSRLAAYDRRLDAFLRDLLKMVPYVIHTILTDNGIQFTNLAHHKHAGIHIFDRVCAEHGIDHRRTKIKHPWTNGQVERMNRTIKEATVKRYHYDNHDQLKQHLDDFIDAYNYGHRLKTLKGLTPYEFICKCWTNEPDRFNLDPVHQMPGLNT